MKATYRADQVGSLLRPAALLEARGALAEGRIDREALRAAEDEAILAALDMQRQVGIDVCTDGEYRQSGWMSDMFDAVEGFVPGGYRLEMRNQPGAETATTPMAVGARLKQTRRLTEEQSTFIRQHAPGPFKISMPSVINFAYLCYQPGLTDQFYPTRADLLEYLVQVVRSEIAALTTEGVPYVQLDAPRYTFHVDHRLREELREVGFDPDEALDESIAADNACLEGLDRSAVTVGMHLCRGNAAGGGWFAGGGYDPIAEKLFGSIQVDRFLLEYDSERAGRFEPLRFVPKDKMVVLGLITSKDPTLESKDNLLRRIDEAAQYVPLENLAISPQCGFASLASGNPLTWDDMRRKLELVVEVAREVWR